MSNPLSVRRVVVQTIDEAGKPDGEPMFGIMAADSYAQIYNDTFLTLDALNASIDEAGSILKAVDPSGEHFAGADHEKIGTDNYYGKDWEWGK